MNKCVLITGATSGIGLATAHVFAANGYDLILTGRREDRLNKVKEEILQSSSVNVTLLCFDVRHYSECEKAMESISQPIDVLINNAGLARGLDYVYEGKIEHWDEMIDTNIKGLLYMTRLVSPGMVARKSGHIINLGSSAGKEVYPKGNVYCATKFAVDGFTRAIRTEMHVHNVRVSQISPGHVEETEFARVRFEWDEERAKIYNDFNPLTAKDVAESIYFIASRPPHVNINDIFVMGTQQAGNMIIDRTGRRFDPI
ncbi:MAG: SDR family NAD(P)-dependent oxidoreductase [Saprospiraceae bacterium]|uniref:SDR family NAD(P)-dependent oxidoreductase n=1 Tax=Candidatus Opimibacter skivensis TaxID=2982028 RepID=A0A9D7XLL1_9BACT|nr:SDR family NAD(P)-dependent oxidoreductase [Candidatus Opimibacter skivensis]